MTGEKEREVTAEECTSVRGEQTPPRDEAEEAPGVEDLDNPTEAETSQKTTWKLPTLREYIWRVQDT